MEGREGRREGGDGERKGMRGERGAEERERRGGTADQGRELTSCEGHSAFWARTSAGICAYNHVCMSVWEYERVKICMNVYEYVGMHV